MTSRKYKGLLFFFLTLITWERLQLFFLVLLSLAGGHVVDGVGKRSE